MSRNEFKKVKEITNKAFQLKKNKNYEEARSLLETALYDYPDNKYLKTSLAELFLRMNRYEEALNLADEVLEEDGGNYRALVVKGGVDYKKRNYEEALDYFKQAYAAKKIIFIATRLINTYIKLKDYDEAFNLCQEWLEREPDNSYLLKLEATIYEKMGKTDEAKELYQDYLEEEPEDEFAYKEEIKLKIKDKPPDEAVKQLRQLLKIGKRKDNVYLYTLLAEKLEDMDRFEEAAAEYKKTLGKEPGNKFVLQRLGYSLAEIGKQEEALTYLKQAFKKDPSDYYTRSKLLSLFKELNKYDEGISYFREIIDNNPGFNNLWGIIKKLNKAEKENEE